MTTIRVALADDHALVRQGLRALLEREQDIVVVGEVNSGETLLSHLQAGMEPDVVLMDIQMKGMSGVEATRRVKQTRPQVQVIGLSALEEEHAALAMMRAGACNYVVKAAAAIELVKAIRTASLRLPPTEMNEQADGSAQKTVVCGPKKRSRRLKPTHNLTRRELDVVRSLMLGCSNKEIARRLIISERTVQTHLSNIFNKMQVTSRTEVVLMAMNNGWIPKTNDLPLEAIGN